MEDKLFCSKKKKKKQRQMIPSRPFQKMPLQGTNAFVPCRGTFGRALLFNFFLLKPAFTSLSLLSFVPFLNSKKTQTVKNHSRRRLSNKASNLKLGCSSFAA
jgi:hypothetical protein